MTDEQAQELIALLKKVPGAISYDGDASSQVVLPLKNGNHVRIGITDNDVAPGQGLWFDQYEGLKVEGCPEGELTKYFNDIRESAG
jgi:hypothetical protein